MHHDEIGERIDWTQPLRGGEAELLMPALRNTDSGDISFKICFNFFLLGRSAEILLEDSN